MRQIVLDTETTGINPKQGNRIIEIGCVELFERKLTGNNFHVYINPDRDSEEGALAVHGLTTDFLRDKPRFHEVVEDLRAYVQGAEVIIHNAPFDLGFLNHEFNLLKLPAFDSHIGGVIDTLVQAKEMRPGKRNSLDALCEHFGISNAHRKLHGALLDAELLADVYLAMTRGQNSLGMDIVIEESGSGIAMAEIALADVIVVRASEAEESEHITLLDGLDKAVKGTCVWRTHSL
ncbi:DNA polymerase-3 subunit epsilon [Duganella sp. CF458]|uniref:DNA polymerase III subunit epsilon n=1 Tax=Duganella sp. CF458 TaxID=1884368 RepID=UPI0008EBA981|nr:DNA polymerase III subunit epsilon [Duganella sp. CF458]SFG82458.1 DNA polymerase-3 subunit epsilon [Duganella sp. CF458]